jgi:hypothetical protein
MNWSNHLRTELCRRAVDYANESGIPHYASRGGTVLFTPTDSAHGSFQEQSFAAITKDADWGLRLVKPHTQRHALPVEHQATARELDSCNSSDALLMNLFCFPGFSEHSEVAALFGYEPGARPTFGVDGRVPLLMKGLSDSATDATELDMQIGDVIVESKLTEADFVTKPKGSVERYRDFRVVFEIAALPQSADMYHGYQLIRNVLCAAEHRRTFALCCDARRPDLVRAWWQVILAVRDPGVRTSCRLVLWQELAVLAPYPLRKFLSLKYGLP